jgi:hypothetical protein
MIRSFPPHPNPLPPGERVGHSSPQQSWGVFWHILINPNFKIQKMSIRFGHFDLESRLDGTCLGFRLPARSRSGEGRDFVLRICDF